MRRLFRSYYRPTQEEFSKMWQECIFAFDANVLLNIYRYTPETRERLFEILKQLQDRIWLPNQVAYEYHEQRLDVISHQLKAYEAMEARISKSLQEIDNELRKYKRHAFANTAQITEIFKDAVEKAKAILQEARSKHPNLLIADNLLGVITDLFDGKVGEPYSHKDYEQVLQDAEERVKQEIPPGYKDTDKDGPKRYGDVVIWFQLIDYAKSQKKPLIFVTDDGKEDWWLRHEGKIIGPRRELIQEMFDKAGATFYLYSTDQFMVQAENFLGLKDQQGSQAAIEEVKEIRLETQALATFLQRTGRVGGSNTSHPFLVPSGGTLLYQNGHPTWLDWHVNHQIVMIRNMGTEPALNVASVIYGAESYLVEGLRSDHAQDIHWTCWLGVPIAPNETVEAVHNLGSSIFFSGHNQIRQHGFNAPPETFASPIQKEPMHTARITITYHDSYHRKYASIFDMVQNIGWQLISFEEDIEEDLHNLQG